MEERKGKGRKMLCAIPMETAVRELDGVLYLALHLARHSIPCLIGERMVNRIVSSSPEPVIYFDTDHDRECARKVLDKGGKVINLHSEGINMFDAPSILSPFIDNIDSASAMCVWGQAQADLIAQNVEEQYRARVKGTGYPSFDLASSRFIDYYRKREIVDAYGEDYILINTNFSYGNNSMGLERWLEVVCQADNLDYFHHEQHRKFVYDLAEYQTTLVGAFVEMTKILSERFPDKWIVFRPHPSENVGFYSEAFDRNGNIAVTNRWSVRSWLATSGPVIHHDCTTGVEALLMGKHVINYRPIFEPGIAAPIPSLVGARAETPAQVMELIEAGSPSPDFVREQLQTVAPYFATVNGNASRTLAGIAADLGGGVPGVLPDSPAFRVAFGNWMKYVGRTIKSRLPDGWCDDRKRRARTALEKFPRIERRQMVALFDKLRRVEPDLPHVEVRKLCLNTFLITKA
ncbi:hypothetical protein BerOc1_01164 [Pseudodesulfovibrio hydrargyri]|uniref:Uncharacterized protein n=1 Tax=Pseudodesulfovibrio hydrargyri TaxID=2125990 RepID=A0A1J5N350_9BACT|nr:surface carbohydrate biosynthesis protein [Pseudodesulfovibrio hydrargyri]OIQ49240.1 hypothetical protein BerOc1_01164 [Pseudodesulfovibrio hydrargyri]